jgi:hypothetical protein
MRDLASLLAAREVGAARRCVAGDVRAGAPADVDCALRSWAEADSLRRCSASYCQLSPAPRSTIAAAFSPDGTLLASTQCVRAACRVRARAQRDAVCFSLPDPNERLCWPPSRAAAATTR